MKLKYNKPLSTLAFNFNLRRYNTGTEITCTMYEHVGKDLDVVVGQCRLILSNPP